MMPLPRLKAEGVRPRSRAWAALPLALTISVSLSACSLFDSNAQSAQPRPAGSQAPSVEPGEPGSDSTSAPTVDPGWDAPAQEVDGTFLSMHEKKDSLEYRAVDSTGEILWTAQRPRSCSAYLVAAADNGPIAVLMDQGSPAGGSLTPTASGYDLTTGEELWGPVETPGALLGNGLVFAGAPQDFIGTGGPRTALNPATGDVVAVEDEDGSPRVIALFGDHLVRSQGSTIIGQDLEGHRLWTRAAEDFDMSAAEVREVPWKPLGDSHALLGDAGSHERTLLDLGTGATVDSEITDAWFDSSSDTLVTVGSRLRGFDPAGTPQWSTPLPEGAEVAAVGADLILIDAERPRASADEGDSAREEQSVITRSAHDGSLVDDETPLLMTIARLGTPHLVSASGAALIGDPQSPLLVTSQS